MVLATKAGFKRRDVQGVLEVTDFRSPILSGVDAALVKRDFSPDFALEHLLKDSNLNDRFAQDLKSPIPALAAMGATIKSAVNQGCGEDNASAMIRAIEQPGNVQVSAGSTVPIGTNCANARSVDVHAAATCTSGLTNRPAIP
jgi:hypothetical protein